MKENVPVMYLFFYCLMRYNTFSNVVEVNKAKHLMGQNVPGILKKHILKEMIDLGLLKRIDRRKVEVVKIAEKKLKKWGVEISREAIEQRKKHVEHYRRWARNQ